MNAKALLALAFASAIGGPALSQDYSHNLGIYPGAQGSPTGKADDEGGASAYGAGRGLTARGGQGPSEPWSAPSPYARDPYAPNPYAPNPYAPRADPYADPAAAYPYGDGATSPYGTFGGSAAPWEWNPNDPQPDPYAPNPYAPGADPYANPAAANPYGGNATSAYDALGASAAARGPNPNDFQSASDLYAPNPYAPVDYADPAAANRNGAGSAATNQQTSGLDQGLGESLFDPLAAPAQRHPYGGASASDRYGSSRDDAGGPKTEELNGDPLGTLGFNPYDAKSLLAPKTRPAGPGASGSGALGSTLSSGGFPSLGPTTPGGPAQ